VRPARRGSGHGDLARSRGRSAVGDRRPRRCVLGPALATDPDLLLRLVADPGAGAAVADAGGLARAGPLRCPATLRAGRRHAWAPARPAPAQPNRGGCERASSAPPLPPTRALRGGGACAAGAYAVDCRPIPLAAQRRPPTDGPSSPYCHASSP